MDEKTARGGIFPFAVLLSFSVSRPKPDLAAPFDPG
jgi:hypothetical protein